MGRDNDKSALLNLSDKQGNVRLQLIVDSLGTAKINFFDNEGKINYSLPSPIN